jgi:signal transduction histidine kinase
MRKELIVATIIYFVTMSTLLMAVYRFLENWHLSEFNFFIAGILVLFVAIGWGYILSALIFAPTKKMENTLSALTNNIIHELNIPLATIQANTTMLKKGLEDEKALKRLARIEDASIRLEKLYNELVYSIRKEMHSIEKERFYLHTLLEDRLAIFEEQGRNSFRLDVPPYEIEVDKIGFEQMFDNLISNAMKYSEKKSLISVLLDGDTLSIVDSGVGMSSTDLLQVYERYFQADHKKEGVGIGLSLVKTYCDETRIDIQIKSEEGVGTTILLDLGKVHLIKA